MPTRRTLFSLVTVACLLGGALMARGAPCAAGVVSMTVSSTEGALELAEELTCQGVGYFLVEWQGEVVLSRGISVSNGSTLNVTGSTDAVIDGGEEVRLFEVSNGSTLYLNNLSLRNGFTSSDGGALNVVDRSFVEALNCRFIDNTASYYGGAIDIYSGDLTLDGETVFTNNTAGFEGGAIYSLLSSYSFDGPATFVGNEAGDSGGAIYSIFSSSSFDGPATFVGNEAGDSGGVISMHLANLTVGSFQSSFINNKAAASGGAIHATTDSRVVVEGPSVFYGNRAASDGGALYIEDSSLLVEVGADFTANIAPTGSGGGIYATAAIFSLNATSFTDNRAAWGGGVAIFSSGSIWSDDTPNSGPSNFTECKFDNNQATDGGAVYSAAGYDMIRVSSFTQNSAEVSGGAFLHSGVLVELSGTTFENNTAGEDGPAVMSLGQAHNISNVDFDGNTLYCGVGSYVAEKNGDNGPDACRFATVCSRCSSCEEKPSTVSVNPSNDIVPICLEVPTGVNKTGEAGMTIATLDLLSGYYRTSSQSDQIMECYRAEACAGGSNVTEYCATGYMGPYCAACEEGYASGLQYSCRSCKGSDKWAAIGESIPLFIVALAVITLVVANLVRVVDSPTVLTGKWERRFSYFRNRLAGAVPLTAIKIVVVAWQIMTQFSAVVNVEYPRVYEDFLGVLNLVNVNIGVILSFSCVVQTNFYDQLLFATLGPMVVLAALVATHLIAQRRNKHSLAAMREAESKHWSVGLFVLFIVYSSVSFAIFQTFVCDSLDDGVTYLRADYSLTCSSGKHTAFMVYAAFMVLVYPVGIPAAFAWWLYSNQNELKRINNSTEHKSDTLEAMSDLWAAYKPHRYYYEVVECGRRTALTGLAVFIYPGSAAQVAIEALFAVIFYAVFENLNPFVDQVDAWLYRFGTWVIYLSMYLALLLKVDTTDEDSASQKVFAGLLIAATSSMVLVVIVQSILSVIKGAAIVRVDVPIANQSSRAFTTAHIVDDSKIEGRWEQVDAKNTQMEEQKF